MSIAKEAVLEALRVYGFAESMDLVIAWTKQQEELVTTSRDAIIFNIERADLYLAVGDIEGALECLEDVRYQAFQEKETNLYDLIMQKIIEIESLS